MRKAMTRTSREIWIKAVNETPLFIRRRASSYLKSIKKISENEWLVWSREGTQYRIRIEKDRKITCSCPYSQQEKEGYCKHVCAVAAHEIAETEVKPWLKKLEKRL